MFFTNSSLRSIPNIFKITFCSVAFFLVFAVILNSSRTSDLAVNATPSSGIVIIDAGHGGEDSGAIGKNGVLEKNLNLEISAVLGKYLEKAGYTVVFTRTKDALLYKDEENIKGMRKIYDLKNRLKIAESYPEAIFVSVHMNSFGEEKYSGLQVYYSRNNELSKRLADSVQAEVKEKLQPENKRAVKPGDNIYLMERCQSPAILIECGFISNEKECKLLCEKEYQKELSFAIMCGIINVSR